MKVTTAGALAQAVRDQRKVNKLTQSETLFKILAALDLELHVVKRGSTLPDNPSCTKEW